MVKRALVWAGVIIALIAGIEIWLHATGDISTAEVGTCTAMTGDDGDSVKVVGCDAQDSEYKIIAQFTDKTEADNQTQNPCAAYPTTEVQFWNGMAKDPGVIWCFEPLHR
jgi:hypothetical protein